MKNLVWLASYPKSGNTWLRLFLTDLLNDSGSPVDINKGIIGDIISGQKWLHRLTGISSELLSRKEINRLRRSALQQLNETVDHTVYFKVHDQYICPHNDMPVIPESATFRAVYIIRNPLDVTLSFSKYYYQSVDETIESMAHPAWRIAPAHVIKGSQFEQYLGSWSEHVTSWADADTFPVLVVRYEDMLADPVRQFRDIVRFLDLEYEEAQIEKSVEHTRFDRLKQQEEKDGFQGNPSSVTRFFRQGKANAWEQVLTTEQIAAVQHNHRDVMNRYGYGV